MSIETSEIPTTSLRERLDNWVKERSVFRYTERQVRRRISHAIITDVLDPVGRPNIAKSVENYRGHVNEAVLETTNRLAKTPKQEGTDVLVKSPLQTDKQTGVTFYTQIRREADAWVSEEINGNNEPISRAKIYNNGRCELTLNFQNLNEKSANPGLMSEPNFPTGSRVLFLNHAAALGVIGWDGK